jgi:outer membrane receptor protein involved in Fe transport
MNMSRQLAAVLTCATVNLWGNCAPADTSDTASQNASSSISATEPGQNLEEVVVTAQKRVEPLQKVPISAIVISGAALAEGNYSSLQSLGSTTPGVHIAAGASSGDDIYIRGVGSGENQYFDQSVATFIDGIYYGRSRSSADTFLDVGQVEILKGPQSTFFGNNSIAGAVNILTRQPGDHEEGYARLLYGMYGTYAAESAATLPINDQLSLRAAAIFTGQSGWIHNVVTGEDAPHTNNKAGRLTLRYSPDPNFDATLKLQVGDNRQAGTPFNSPLQMIGCSRSPTFLAFYGANCAPAIAAGLPQGFGNNDNAGIGGQGAWLSSYEGVLTLNYRIAGNTLTSVTGFTHYDYDNAVDGSNLTVPTLTAKDPEQERQFSQEFRIASPTGQSIEYLAGVYFQTGNTTAMQGIDLPYLNSLGGKPAYRAIAPYLPIGYNINFSQDEQVYAAFASATFNVTDALKIIGGLRETSDHKSADAFSNYGMATSNFGGVVPVPANVSAIEASIFGHAFGTPATEGSFTRTDHAWLPSAKLQYDVAPNIMTYASYSRGFLAGGFNAGDTTGVSSNVPFKPETVNAYEVGVKSKLFENKVLINIDAFRSDYTDRQVSAVTPTSIAGILIKSIRNAAAARSQGVELEGEWALNSFFRLSSYITYLDSIYISYPNAPATFDQAALGLKNQDLSGRPTQFAPKWSGNLAAAWTQPVSNDYRVVAQASSYFTGAYFVGSDADDPYFHQGGYAQIDARLSLQNVVQHWTVDVIGKNLNDRVIFENGLMGLLAWKAEPRNVAVQFRYDWK